MDIVAQYHGFMLNEYIVIPEGITLYTASSCEKELKDMSYLYKKGEAPILKRERYIEKKSGIIIRNVSLIVNPKINKGEGLYLTNSKGVLELIDTGISTISTNLNNLFSLIRKKILDRQLNLFLYCCLGKDTNYKWYSDCSGIFEFPEKELFTRRIDIFNFNGKPVYLLQRYLVKGWFFTTEYIIYKETGRDTDDNFLENYRTCVDKYIEIKLNSKVPPEILEEYKKTIDTRILDIVSTMKHIDETSFYKNAKQIDYVIVGQEEFYKILLDVPFNLLASNLNNFKISIVPLKHKRIKDEYMCFMLHLFIAINKGLNKPKELNDYVNDRMNFSKNILIKKRDRLSTNSTKLEGFVKTRGFTPQLITKMKANTSLLEDVNVHINDIERITGLMKEYVEKGSLVLESQM